MLKKVTCEWSDEKGNWTSIEVYGPGVHRVNVTGLTLVIDTGYKLTTVLHPSLDAAGEKPVNLNLALVANAVADCLENIGENETRDYFAAVGGECVLQVAAGGTSSDLPYISGSANGTLYIHGYPLDPEWDIPTSGEGDESPEGTGNGEDSDSGRHDQGSADNPG